MPISPSAKKSLRVASRRLIENRAWKQRVKSQIRWVSAESLPQAVSVIDKAAKRGVMHPNRAARLKSRLMRRWRAPSPAKPTRPRPKKASSAR